jgi:heme oxygenase
VLSYYEFKQPMNDRLTDEAWRDLLAWPEKPARPGWYRPLLQVEGTP